MQNMKKVAIHADAGAAPPKQVASELGERKAPETSPPLPPSAKRGDWAHEERAVSSPSERSRALSPSGWAARSAGFRRRTLVGATGVVILAILIVFGTVRWLRSVQSSEPALGGPMVR
jgi:hypothetical protein